MLRGVVYLSRLQGQNIEKLHSNQRVKEILFVRSSIYS